MHFIFSLNISQKSRNKNCDSAKCDICLVQKIQSIGRLEQNNCKVKQTLNTLAPDKSMRSNWHSFVNPT